MPISVEDRGPIGLIVEEANPPRVPIRLETIGDVARALGPDVEVLEDGLKLTLRAFRSEGCASAAVLVENTSKRAWSNEWVGWFLVDDDEKTVAFTDGDLVAGYEGALPPGEIIGRTIRWSPTALGATHIVGRVLGAEHEAPMVSEPRPLTVGWAAPKQEGLELSFQLLAIQSSDTDLATRRTHLPRIAVTNTGTVLVASIWGHKHLSDPSGGMAPVDKAVWVISVGAPSLMPGETRTFTAWSWEDGALSEWSSSVREVRIGTRL